VGWLVLLEHLVQLQLQSLQVRQRLQAWQHQQPELQLVLP
jgi:hypothetical protein